MKRVQPDQAFEFGWKEFCIYCEGHNIGIHYELWSPWWDIWKAAYHLSRSHTETRMKAEQKTFNERRDSNVPTCCRKHWEEATNRQALAIDSIGPILVNPIGMPFMCCKTCGNKRCPKATDCELECTNSNKPGQEGSICG